MTTTLKHVLERTVDAHGGAEAIVAGDLRWTWRQLAGAVDAAAEGLRRTGITRGDAVALVMENSPGFVVAFLAATTVGATAVPLNPALTTRELAAHVDGCGVRLVIADPGAGEAAAALADRIGATWAPMAADGRLTLGAFDDAATGGHLPAPPQPDDVALIGFSSGSTGTPKRIPRSQRNLVAECDHYAAAVGTSVDDVILVVVPLFHAHGLGNAMLAAVRSGATLVIQPGFDRGAATTALQDERVTIFPAVPVFLDVLASSKSFRAAPLPSLRLVPTGGAPLDPTIAVRFRDACGVPPRQLYGCSEAGSVTIDLDPEPDTASVGRPFPGVRVTVADEDGRPCPPGQTGEVRITGPALTTGYLAPAEVNDAAFRDGWFLTGDLGHIADDGRLHLTGRAKLYIATGGHRVDPIEVERVIAADPRVSEAIVVGVPVGRSREAVKAVVVADDPSLDREAVIALCRAQLAEFKVPRLVEFRDEIPRSPIGKILRKYLVEPASDQ